MKIIIGNNFINKPLTTTINRYLVVQLYHTQLHINFAFTMDSSNVPNATTPLGFAQEVIM